MKKFGTLEYVLDQYSKTWSWKVTGARAVSMVSKLIPQSWYGETENEAIIPDNTENIQQIKWILDRYPLEVLSKSAWQRKATKSKTKKKFSSKIEKLERVKPGKQFRGKLYNFQKEGLDFLLKSSGNALLADEIDLQVLLGLVFQFWNGFLFSCNVLLLFVAIQTLKESPVGIDLKSI